MIIDNKDQQKNTNETKNLVNKIWKLQLSPISVTLVPEQLSEVDIINSTMTNYTDIIKYESELQKADNKLREAELIRRDLVQNIIHGLKIPCNGIFALVTALYEIEKDSDKKDYLASIVNCAEELLDYYNNILSYSVDNTGLPPIAFSKFDPKLLVRKIIAKAKPIANRKGLNLSCNFQYDITNSVISDSYRIQAILEQLIDNSIKFTEQGNIVVTVNMFAISPIVLEQDNREMVLQFIVHDTGMGLTQEIQQYLHKQSENAAQYAGLNFVKRLINEMRGEIEVTSKQGKTTTIKCNIPVKLPLLDDYEDK